jgi:hypothetical protein
MTVWLSGWLAGWLAGCLPACLHAWKKSAPTGRIFMKFDT